MFASKYYGSIANPELMHEPIYYALIWTFIGVICLALVGLAIFLIFYLTRRKPIKTIANLAPKVPRKMDLEALRNKYLSMVDDTEQRFGMKKIRANFAHQELSLIVRLFYAEASGFHAEVLTLSDLKRSKNVKLANTIEQYYPEEFSGITRGSVLTSARKARDLIMDDEAISRILNGGSK